MKIQCACGTKYAFDVTPEMARNPIRFVCQSCGQDNSETINQLIRQQFPAEASRQPMMAPPPVIAPPPPGHRQVAPMNVPAAVPSGAATPPSPPVSAPGLRVSGASHSSPATAPSAAAAGSEPPVEAAQVCMRHAGQLTTHRCMVCHKPMCPKCMESFGFVCSAYCKGQAETRGMHVPVYGGQRTIAQSRQFRKMGTMITIGIAVFTVVMAGWGWYAWVGSVPHPTFSTRFSEVGYSGELQVRPDQQAVFLHGGRVIRHDMKEAREVWANQLLDKKKIAEEAAASLERMKAARQKAIEAGAEFEGSLPSLQEIIDGMEKAAAAAMHLHANGENIWVSFPDRIVRFDWQTGKQAQEISLKSPHRKLSAKGDELFLDAGESGLLRLNLASAEIRTEATSLNAETGGKSSPTTGPGGITSSSRSNSAVRSQNLSAPARAALPAVRAASANQERLVNEMKTTTPAIASPPATESGPSPVILTGDGPILLSAKPVSGKGGSDENTLHRVVLRRVAAGNEDWSGELPGWPELHSLKTVDVLAGTRKAIVLDKGNRKLWEISMENRLSSPAEPAFLRPDRSGGQGPCAEDKGVLYVYDGKNLSAYDLANGNSRWREPVSSLTEMFFDDRNGIYVNGITVGNEKPQPVVSKIDAQTGKTQWIVPREGSVAHVSGKLIYTVDSYVGDDDEADGLLGTSTIFHVPAYLRIRRLDASNGRILWHHHQPRCPLDIQFDHTTIHLLFKKELQTLKFIVL